MDKEALMFTSPDFYRYAVHGLIEEGARRIRDREPVSDIEQWVGVCDQLADASTDDISEVIASILGVASAPSSGAPGQGENPYHEDGSASSDEFKPNDVSESDLGSLGTQTAPPTEASVPPQPETDPQPAQQPQDPFGMPSFNHIGGDIFAELSKELGVDLDTESGE